MDYGTLSLDYFEAFYKLQESDRLDDNLAKAILELGKMRGYRSHPRGDMGIIERFIEKTGCSPSDAIDKLRSKKAVLTFKG
jgi:hypothetical protein